MLKNTFLGLGILFSSINYGFANFGLESTHIIYNEQNNNERVVFNNDQNTPYLLQYWVEDLNGNKTQDFIVESPANKILSQHRSILQLQKNATLSNNVESLYWVNVKFIAQDKKETENTLNNNRANKVKLIYRPDSLSHFVIEKEISQLAWSIRGGDLVVLNTSPYFINIDSVFINGEKVKEATDHLAPRSKTIINVDKTLPKNNIVKLVYLDDMGEKLPLEFKL